MATLGGHGVTGREALVPGPMGLRPWSAGAPLAQPNECLHRTGPPALPASRAE
jgi:hypothetical protein